jgi:hypothetical protein
LAGQLHHYLEQLDRPVTWRLSALPTGITVEVLRLLDARGLIELRGWQLDNPTTDPRRPQPLVPVPSSLGWVSPTAKPMIYGTWEQIVAAAAHDPRLVPEIRLTEAARAQLAESRLGLGASPESASSGWLTVTEAAKIAGKATYEISRLVDQGKIKANGKTGRDRRVDASDLARFLLAGDDKATIKKLRKRIE